MNPKPNMKLLIFDSTIATIILAVIAIAFVAFVIYIIYDGYIKLHAKCNLGRCRTMDFADYKAIKARPKKYEYHAAYGVENALTAFNSEVPYLVDLINLCISRNRSLINRYENNENPDILNTCLELEIQLTSMISGNGLNLLRQCKFYTENSSKTFQVEVSPETMYKYVKNATDLHMQFSIIKTEEFKSEKVVESASAMYEEFYEFFKQLNELIHIHKNNKYNDVEIEKEEEIPDDKCSSAGSAE